VAKKPLKIKEASKKIKKAPKIEKGSKLGFGLMDAPIKK